MASSINRIMEHLAQVKKASRKKQVKARKTVKSVNSQMVEAMQQALGLDPNKEGFARTKGKLRRLKKLGRKFNGVRFEGEADHREKTRGFENSFDALCRVAS
jgi:hypothetical protein